MVLSPSPSNLCKECLIALNAVASGYVRMDRIVIRLNRVDRLVEIVVKEGIAVLENLTPSAPAIIQPDYGDYYELGLATVRIRASQTVLTDADITDTRYDSAVCGISEPLVGVIDTSAIFAQLYALMEQYKGSIDAWMSVEESEIMKWFETIKGQLSEDAAINLQLMIESLGKEVTEKLNAHVNQSILGESGVHGLRFYNDLLQVHDEETQTWFTMVTAPNYKKMTVQIDLTNSNPETCITYADDALKMMVGSDEWDEFFGHKPCLFKNGKVVGYLNPNNFAQFENGTVADITSADAGDVMIEFPRRGLSITTVGTVLTISMTDNPDDTEFTYYAHSRGDDSKDYFYYGAYRGYLLDSKLRSISGQVPSSNQTIGACRMQAQGNGDGYELTAFYQVTFLQAMYLLKYKNLDSRSTVGWGSAKNGATGSTDEHGMDGLKSSSSTTSMKLFGIENIYGGQREWLDGLVTELTGYVPEQNSDTILRTTTTAFNDTGQGYTFHLWRANSYVGFISKVCGTSEFVFIPEETEGSTSTYFSSYSQMFFSRVATFGYSWSTLTGIFRIDLLYNSTDVADNVGARLMYL